ncbi:MAG: formate dehydrogenase accessory sulfurtransferase FdhD [Saprospiraceae bacterium]
MHNETTNPNITHKSIFKVRHDGSAHVVSDIIAREAPLQLLINNEPLTITMRSPGDDIALCAGFLWAERIISHPSDITSISKTEDDIIVFEIKNPMGLQSKTFLTNSSCGVCGKTSLEEVSKESPFKNMITRIETIHREMIYSLPAILKNYQSSFNLTGGIHGCAFFDNEGKMIDFAEDVGRHNALDKLIGKYVLMDKLPIDKYILLLSGRISFELVQKADMAGIKIICGIGAPSDLAIEMAEINNITLIGFLKADSFNIYSHSFRIAL